MHSPFNFVLRMICLETSQSGRLSAKAAGKSKPMALVTWAGLLLASGLVLSCGQANTTGTESELNSDPTMFPYLSEEEAEPQGFALPLLRAERLRNPSDIVQEAFYDQILFASPILYGHDRIQRILNDSQPVQGFVSVFDGLAVPNETMVRAAFDDSQLYLLIECEEQADEPKLPRQLWVTIAPGLQGDAFLQVQIDGTNERATIVERPEGIGRGAGVIRKYRNHGQRLSGPLSLEQQETEKGFLVMLGIPYEVFSRESAPRGEQWRINVYRDRAGLQPVSSWFPLRNSYIMWDVNGAMAHVEDRYGILQFNEPTMSGIPGPVLSELTYVTPTTKSIRVEGVDAGALESLELVWRAPDGSSSVLEFSKSEESPQKILINFEHPPVQGTGRHQLQLRTADGEIAASVAFDNESLARAGAGAHASMLASLREAWPKRHVPLEPPSGEALALLEMMPDRSGLRYAASPAVPGDRRESSGLFSWSPERPHELKCRKTGHVFPDPENYPTSGAREFVNPLGQTVQYPYVTREDGVRCDLEAHLWWWQRNHILERIESLARQDPSGAAHVLYALARKYPGYNPTFDHRGGDPRPLETVGPPFQLSTAGVWDGWPIAGDSQKTAQLARAWRTVAETDLFDQMSDALGIDVSDQIEYGMIRPSVEHVRSFPRQHHNTAGHAWQRLIEISQALDEPDYIHDALQRRERFLALEFFVDGFFNEVSTSYHRQSHSNTVWRISQALEEYEDPADYLSPRTGQRLIAGEDLVESPALAPVLERAAGVRGNLVYPNGRLLPIQDTWAVDTYTPPEVSSPYLYPAAKVAKLASGTGEDQIQVYLMYHTKYTGHLHHDALGLALFAKGQELLPELGYDRSHIRYWSQSSLSHNMVVVNARDVNHDDIRQGGDLSIFAPNHDLIQVARAESTNAYPDIVDEYSREVWLIQRPDGESYVVDVFRVSGGERHEYTLNGEALHDSSFHTSLELEDYGPYLLPEGIEVREPGTMREKGHAGGEYEAYLFVRDVGRAELPEGTYQLLLKGQEIDLPIQDLEPKPTGNDIAGLKITGFVEAGPDTELFLGKAPSKRTTRFSRETRSAAGREDLMRHWMPKMVLRRSGEDIASTFVHVFEPYGPDQEPSEAVVEHFHQDGVEVIRIQGDDWEDWILSANEPTPGPVEIGPILFEGTLGFVRFRGERAEEMVLVGGKLLQTSDAEIDGQGVFVAQLHEVLRQQNGDEVDGFVFEDQIEAGFSAESIQIVHPDGNSHTYPVKAIRARGDATVVEVSLDPGFELHEENSSQQVFFPFTYWNEGTHSANMPSVTSFKRRTN